MIINPVRATVLLTVLVGCSALALAQPAAGWVRMSADDGGFTVEVPGGFVSHKDGATVTAYYHGDGVAGSVQRSKEDGRDRLKWLGTAAPGDKTVYQSGEFEGFSVVLAVEDHGAGSYTETIHLGSARRYYSVSAHGRDGRDPRVRRVLDSVRVNGKPLFRSAAATAAHPPSKRASRGSCTGGCCSGRTGRSGGVVMDLSLDASLAESCAHAARRIKFFPAQMDGKPVDQWRPITFRFDIY